MGGAGGAVSAGSVAMLKVRLSRAHAKEAAAAAKVRRSPLSTPPLPHTTPPPHRPRRTPPHRTDPPAHGIPAPSPPAQRGATSFAGKWSTANGRAPVRVCESYTCLVSRRGGPAGAEASGRERGLDDA